MLKLTHPNWSTKQIMRVVSYQWKQMSNAEKNSYKELSETDRKRFEQEKKLVGGGKRKQKALSKAIKIEEALSQIEEESLNDLE